VALHIHEWAWLPDGLRARVAVQVDVHGQVLQVRDARPDEPASPGILLPGLVNAHTHLELSQLRGAVPGGEGSTAWVEALVDSGLPPDPAANDDAAREARDAGARAIIDVSNRGDTEPHMRAAGLSGVMQIECLGVAPDRWRPRFEAASRRRGSRQVAIRPTAHSPISCAPALLLEALRERPLTAPAPTIHCDEDPADRHLLADRTGPWAGFHERIGHDWRGGLGRGRSGVQVLDDLGLLGPHLGLVHLVAADGRDLDRVARSGATAILCPRSNLHISGRLPDVPGMVRRGIPLAIGTDSLASTPDLDLLAEAATLAARFPDVPREHWLTALTRGGAALLGAPGWGALRPGTHPGLLHIDLPTTGDPLAALLDGTRWPRSFLA
jgi:cytosine/adenosine deaminase-related metal-dependent hydrolase